MKLLVGLGNPGARHARNRHNIGFMVLDEIMRVHDFAAPRSRFQGQFAEGRIGGERVLALKPSTFMNESGRAVAEAAHYYKIEVGDIVVIHDELDLPAGKLKVKTGGGTAGHNGLRSIDRHLGPEFCRVRIGIGHPGPKHLVHGYVLKDFAKQDADWVEPMLSAIADNADLLVRGEDGTFMNRVHLALNPEPEPADTKKPGPASDDAPARAKD